MIYENYILNASLKHVNTNISKLIKANYFFDKLYLKYIF